MANLERFGFGEGAGGRGAPLGGHAKSGECAFEDDIDAGAGDRDDVVRHAAGEDLETQLLL